MDIQDRNRFIEDNMPFIIAVAARTSGRHVERENSDLVTSAMLAFNDAIESYREELGGFYSYAGRIIHNRVVDVLRQENRWQAQADPLEYHEGSLADRDRTQERVDALELARYGEILKAHGLTFHKLAAGGPRHKDTRRMLVALGRRLCLDREVVEAYLEKGRLPYGRIARDYGVSIKVLSVHRHYIASILLAYHHGVAPVMDWIAEMEGGAHDEKGTGAGRG
ncbi:sigma-70 family RNA polymerase sigma factor [Anaerotalea alkaliphila]|uniref:Sigma-70 family RNA polymerase sigma factor n=1 Tax=Anaerotalea alkaliphila TaxID=2662126 RepID=A0A7X5HWA4_9FIRM|nr:sigma-70 family RNA polymerase sigma factor [Anaerotalea alkaliphila]NDL67830.1 sigma-70 family RNA polymerase sigma factor [Anaerotalea alkaliphila]